MGEWRESTLLDICDGLQTGPFGGQLHKREYVDHGVPVVMPKDMINARVSTATIAQVTEAKAVEQSKHRCEVGDILFGRRGDIGRAALITDGEEGWLCGTGSLRARPKSERAYPPFLIYAVTSKYLLPL